jgi:glucan phosphoethanolaminetransferase (alkaline phosphatase superfamily)
MRSFAARRKPPLRREILIKGLQARLDEEAKDGKDRIVVLHQLGNHGPAYYLRYPAAFKRFTPTCDTQDLGQCDPAHIVNAYDNALPTPTTCWPTPSACSRPSPATTRR